MPVKGGDNEIQVEKLNTPRVTKDSEDGKMPKREIPESSRILRKRDKKDEGKDSELVRKEHKILELRARRFEEHG